MAPVNRAAQSSLAFGQVARAPSQQIEPALDPRNQSAGRENLDTRGSQLDSQRQAVQSPAEIYDSTHVLDIQAEVRFNCGRTLYEQADRWIIEETPRRKGSRAIRNRQRTHR